MQATHEDSQATTTAFRDMEAQKQYMDVWLKYLEQDERNCTQGIEEKKRELSEYDKLKEQIGELTKKLEKNVHIPVGRNAFLPGTLDHTNEFYTLIGDNHFARKSSFRTIELLDRRQKVIGEQMEKLEEELNLVKQRREFAAQLMKASSASGEEVEIREPYDESDQSSLKREPTFKVSKVEYDALIKHLDELEALEEAEEEELDEMMEEPDSDDADSDEREAKAEELDRLVKQQKLNFAAAVKGELASVAKGSATIVKKPSPLNTVKESKKGVRFSNTPLESANSLPLIQEIPMDESAPQSILKHTDHVPRIDRQAVEAMDRRNQTVVLPESKAAFKGPIVERDPLAMLDKPSTSEQQPTTAQKQSKFKTQRRN